MERHTPTLRKPKFRFMNADTISITSKILNPRRQQVPMQPYSILLPSAAIVLPSPPLHHILPCELRRQVFDEGGTPGFCSLQPWFSCRGKVGFWRREGGEGKHLMEGAEQHKYHIINIYMAALHGSRSDH